MNNEFDLFAKSADVVDDLSAELEKAAYKWTNKFTTVLMGLLLVAVGASGGVWYAHHTTPATNGFAIGSTTGANANFAGRVGRNGGAGTFAVPTAPGIGGTSGTITKIDGTTITIQSRDGKNIEIKAAADTPVLSTSRQDIAALKVGDRLTATGETAADGSITPIALTQGGGMGGGFGGGQGRSGAGNGALSPQGTNNSTQANQTPITSNKSGKQKGVTKNKNGKSATTQNGAPAVNGAPGAGPGGGGGPGGGNGELRKCLTDAGIEFAPGSRPDLTDPTVAAAFEKCRALFPGGGGQGGSGGPGGGGFGGGGQGGGGQGGGGQRGGQGGGAPAAPAAN